MASVVRSLDHVVAVYDPLLSLSHQTQECYINILVNHVGPISYPYEIMMKYNSIHFVQCYQAVCTSPQENFDPRDLEA